jgi:precorrin isomerase
MYTAIKNLSKGLMAAALGLVLVFGGSAFKSENNRIQYKFRYTGINHAESDVETLSNWTYDASAPSCVQELEAPCTITVDAAFVNTGGTPTLKSTLNLDADPYSLSSAYVVDSADDDMEINNRAEQ